MHLADLFILQICTRIQAYVIEAVGENEKEKRIVLRRYQQFLTLHKQVFISILPLIPIIIHVDKYCYSTPLLFPLPSPFRFLYLSSYLILFYSILSDLIFNNQIAELYPKKLIPKLPAKKLVGSTNPAFVQKRTKELTDYLNLMAKVPGIFETGCFRSFIDPFEQVDSASIRGPSASRQSNMGNRSQRRYIYIFSLYLSLSLYFYRCYFPQLL